MATIEERAKDFAKGRRYTLTAYEGYRAGANDQKAVDEERIAKLESFIERATKLIEAEKAFRESLEAKEKKLIENACKACENELRRLKTLLNERGVPSNLISVGKSLSRIRKAMEEYK